ncbi:MAG: hypothetical protein A2420_03995 [Candidatus Moranbacteria bacterium RIFOXYC1_FULL_44_13]|nr:MAG: hypothetical protein A2420_03995 [Candidatus Moranbacteria bacterium RIFOXYC1_FULL_44_13]
MNTFYLIRHGEKTNEENDAVLTKRGKIQAKKTARFLSDKKISKIISSPYKRTVETAEIIGGLLNVDIVIDDRLKERMTWGSVTGQSLKGFLKEWKYSDSNRSFKPTAGVSAYNSGKKAREVMDETFISFEGQNTVYITHGGVVKELLRNIFEASELKRFEAEFPDQNGKECSVTILNRIDDRFLLEKVGYTAHL